jgi:hypothetical protein
MRDITERELNWLNSDWIKVAGWIGTFSEDERTAFESLRDACSLGEFAWMRTVQAIGFAPGVGVGPPR